MRLSSNDALEQDLAHRLMERAAVQFPDKIAVRTRTRQLTYRQINALANDLARQLRAICPINSFVMVHVEDNCDVLIANLALQKAGCVWVPLEARLPVEGIKAIQELIHADAFICDSARWERVASISGTTPMVNIDHAHEAHSPEDLNEAVPLDGYHSVSFTSGTTGTPKGVPHLRRGLMANLRSHRDDLQLTAQDNVLIFGSLNLGASLGICLAGLEVGATILLLDLAHETPTFVLNWSRDHHVTIMTTVSSFFRTLFSPPPDEPLSEVRIVRLGSEPVLTADWQLFKRSFLPGTRLMHTYGSTETGTLSRGSLDHDTRFEGALVPVGHPSNDVELLIVDEALQPLPVGEVGEILAKVRYAPSEYWRAPELSADKFSPDPDDPQRTIIRTGDLGRLGADGNFYHLGRRDAMVKIRGFRVEPSFVENQLLQCHGVKMATVQVHHQQGIASLVAYVVPHVDYPLNMGELRQQLGESLPDFMTPTAFVIVDSLPLLPNGKINLKALPAPRAVQHTVSAPQTETETALAALFAEVLEIEVGRDGQFFEFGGDSLRAMRLVARANQTFSSLLTSAVIYAYPTVEKLAAYVDAGAPILSGLVALNPYGTQPALLCVPGQDGNAMHFRQLVSELGHDYPVYAFQHPRYDARAPRYITVEALATHYLSLMRSISADQPYWLVGASVGGVIVFEMARQLRAIGNPPLGVILVDSHFPGVGVTLKEEAAGRLAQRREREAGLPLLKRARNEFYRTRRAMIQAFPLDKEAQTLKRVKRETEAMAGHYRPTAYEGRLIYLSCRQDRQQNGKLEQHFESQWQGVARGAFELIDVPGSHLTVLEMPHVKTVARVLRRIMAARDR